MTASGPESVTTPITGLVEMALRTPTLQRLIDLAADRPEELALVGPASARSFVAAALARQGPLLVVTATGREADDLSAELRGVFGDAVAMFPSWETLPHERLSPGVDTVGARMMLLRRLTHPQDSPARAAAEGRGHRGPLAAAADGLATGPGRTPHLDRRRRAGFRRCHRRAGRACLHPGGHGRTTRRIRRPRWHSRRFRRRPPSTRYVSSSGVTRSARCGCSRWPISGQFPRSMSTPWSRSRAANCC